MNYQKHRQHHASQALFLQSNQLSQPSFAEPQFGRIKQSTGMPMQPMYQANQFSASYGGKMKPMQPMGLPNQDQQRLSTPGPDKFLYPPQQISSPLVSTPIKPAMGISSSSCASGFRGFPSKQTFQDQRVTAPSQLYSRDNGYNIPGRAGDSTDFVETSKKQNLPQFDNTLKIFLRLASSLELFRYLMKQERYDEVISQLSSTIKQVLERVNNDSDNGFYMSWFNLHSQATDHDDQRNVNVKTMDANTLIEVFEIINDVVAIIITQSLKEQYLKEYLDFLVQVKSGIDKNLDENEFEGISEFESEIMKHSLDARLYTNLSCYYSKYLSDHKSSHAYSQKATQAEFEIFQLKKATSSNQIYQLNDDSIQDKSNHSELNGLAIGYNNQAVIELKQGNATEALKLSQSSVIILETPVFQYMLSHPGRSDEQFHQKLQSLLIAYYNLAMSHEQLYSNSGQNAQNENQMKALQIYEQGFELSSRFMNPGDILVKKFKFKLFKIKQLHSDFNNSAKSVKTNISQHEERQVASNNIQTTQNLVTSPSVPSQEPEFKPAAQAEEAKKKEEDTFKALLAQQSEEMKKQIEQLQKQNEQMQVRYVTMMKEQKEELESKMGEQARTEEEARRKSEAEAQEKRQEMLREEMEKTRMDEERKRAEEVEKELQRKQQMEEEARAEKERQEEVTRQLNAAKAAKDEQERQEEIQRRLKDQEMKKAEQEAAERERQRACLRRQQELIREAQRDKDRELEESLKELELAEEVHAKRERERAQERKAQQEKEIQERRRAEEAEAERREQQEEAERIEKLLAAKAEIRRKAEVERMKEIEEEEARLEKAKIARQERLRALRRQEEEAEAEAEQRLIEEHERRAELQQRADLQREAEAYITEVEASIQAKQLEAMLKRQVDMQAQMRRDMEEQRRQFLEEMEKQKQEIEEEKERLRQEREAAKREWEKERERELLELRERAEREAHFDQLNQVEVNYQDHSRRSEQSYGYMHQDIGQSHQHAEPQVPNISESREPYRGSAPSSLPFDQDIPQVSLQQDTSGNIDLQKQTPKAATLNNISLPIRDYKEVDVNQMIAEEQNLYDASRAFLNNGSEILKEIDRKRRIMISKIVYSKGMYNKFTITADNEKRNVGRTHQIAAKEGNFMNSGTNQGEASPGYQPVFQLTGYCQEASISFHPTTLYYYELDSLMKLLMTKEVLPQCTSINHIRCFEDMAKYLLFPFMQLFIPATGNEMANLEESSEVSSHHEVSSQISHNLSNASNPNKTQIELWGRSPGLLKQSIVIDFLRDVCNIAIYHVEDRNFRVSITSLEKENKGLNQLVLDLMVDEQSFEYFFRSLDARDFKQNGRPGVQNQIQDDSSFNIGVFNGPIHPEKSSSEVFLGSVEIIGAEFFKYLEPCIRAYEELLIQEFGKEISFDCVVLDKKGIVYQIRLSEASEESEPKVELWTLIDSQRHGYFMIRCQTLYKLRIKKHVHEEIVRTYKCQYSEFNSLFGIKKHELDRSLLMIFCYKYLSTLFLFMPTMHCNKGDEEDSDYEEEVRISHRKAECLANARKIVRIPSSSGLVSEPRLLTAQLMGFDDTEFLGIKVTLFNQKQLKEEGYFFFVNEKKWALTEAEKEQFGIRKQQKRKARKDANLIYNYKLVHFLQDQGFTKIFAGTKFIRNHICWEVQNNGDESSSQLIKGTVFESYFTPEMVNKQRFGDWLATMRN